MGTLGSADGVTLFALFGVGSQAVLAAFFAARRWAPPLAERLGWIAYAVGGLGVVIGGVLFASGQSWRLWAGPLLLAGWALLGAIVDLWRPVEWRSPVRPGVFFPYVTLYFFAQMFLWWPLWDRNRFAWACFLVLFVINTALNLVGHFGAPGSEERREPDAS